MAKAKVEGSGMATNLKNSMLSTVMLPPAAVALSKLESPMACVDGDDCPVGFVCGGPRRLCVHRKGATRAFPPGHPELAPRYRDIGQPVLIPGDMGRYSFVLVGTDRAFRDTFGSTCHGAGRRMSRHQARKEARTRNVPRELEARGILVRAASRRTVDEEIPEAYKDVEHVVDVVHGAGIGRKVAKLVPVGVVKG